MKDSPSPPPAPDPTQTAQAQSAANIATAIANARLNRVNQMTPWGSITYTQGPADANGVPTWSSQIQLTPAQQQLLEQQQGMQGTRNTLASQMLNSGSIKPLDFSHLHSMYDPSTHSNYAGAVNATPAAPQAPAPQLSPQVLQQLLAALSQAQGGNGPPSPSTTQQSPQAAQQPSQAAQQPQQQQTAQAAQQSLYGSAGDLAGMMSGQYQTGSTNPGANLPPWLASQFRQQTMNSGGDGGQDFTAWQLGDGNKVIKDQQGNQVVQLGDPKKLMNQPSGSGEWLKDPSKVRYDPTLGYVTDPNNVGSRAVTDRGMAAFGAALAGGGLADALGAFGGAMPATEDAGLNMANPFAASEPGAFDAGGSAGQFGNVFGPQGAPVTDLSTMATQPNIFQQGMNNLMQGRGLLGLRPPASSGISLLASLLRRPQTAGGH